MSRIPKIITKEDILRAMRVTKSNRQASRYLGVYHTTYKKYAMTFFDKETGKTLYEIHKSSGKGIPKHIKFKTADIPIDRLINGINEYPTYSLTKLKHRLIHEHILPEECSCCGFKERRILDYKVPVMLSFKDGNKFNWGRENLTFLCYNCYFIQIGDILDNKKMKKDEHFTEEFNREDKVWEMDDNMKNHFKDLGLIGEDENDDGFDFRDYKS